MNELRCNMLPKLVSLEAIVHFRGAMLQEATRQRRTGQILTSSFGCKTPRNKETVERYKNRMPQKRR